MKKIFLLVVLSVLAINISTAQDVTPELLKQPVNWEFERFNLPPSFAPGITYKGFEELRFAPGMFKKDSLDYFTYAFVASIDSNKVISKNDIRIYLLQYYKGLCNAVANDKKLTIDTAAITVTTANEKIVSGRQVVYTYELTVFGVFTDGAPVKLNLEATIMQDDAHRKTYILFITSPQPKTSVVWKKLYAIQKDFKIPAD